MKYLSCILFCIASMQLSAQDTINRLLEHRITAGINIGASAPISLPANVRKVESWSPLFNPSLGYECVVLGHKKWSIGASILLDYKGMNVKSDVMYLQTQITVESGSSTGTFSGYFTGKNETHVRNVYVSVPIYAIYHAGAKWRIKAGVYVARLVHADFTGEVTDGYMRNGSPTGEKIDINKATFDLSDKQRKWDFGVHVGGERQFCKRFAAKAAFNWGLIPLFPKDNGTIDFNMYNLYGTLGVSYRLR